MDCIFCKIIAGEKDAFKLGEDEHSLAILDEHPRTKGHTLVIPKKHYRRVYDIREIGSYFIFIQQITKSLINTLNPDWVQFISIGESIEHAHLHVLPRYKNDGHGVVVDFAKRLNFNDQEMREICEKMRSKL